MFGRKTKGVAGDAAQEKRVAIDVGLFSIKIAYFINNLLCLDEFPLFDQPKDLRGLKQQDLFNIQTSAVNRAITMINPKGEIIFSPQPSLQVLTRVLYRPSDTDIRTYINKEFPFEPDQFSYDIQRIDNTNKARKTKKSEKRPSRIAVAVADLDFIQRSIALLGEFQLQIKRFTPPSVGLLNYLLLTTQGDPEPPLILLDLGALYSHLIIYREKGQFLARTLEMGGNHLNQELVEKLNVDFETAERIKTERKLIDDNLFDSKGASTSLPMFQAINSVLFGLVDELKSSLTFFEDFYLEDLSNATVLLSGGTSNLRNLDRFLERELSLPIKKAEKAVHDLSPDHHFSPQFASTVGLLGRPSNNDLLDINLMNNIEGVLFKLEDGDYYLTSEGFINKKKYKKKQKIKTFKPSIPGKSPSESVAPALTPLAFLKELPARLKGLLKGEKSEMREMRVSFGEINFRPLKHHLKMIFVALGALFLTIYGVNRFYWAPEKRGLDRIISRYETKRSELDRVRAALTTVGDDTTGIPLTANVSRVDKIIWSDILRAIADAIPERVWISSLVVEGMPPALILSCHVSSYGEDHLKDIALFIQNLKARKAFQDGFKEVRFHTALRNKVDRNVCDFTLTMPLKRDMIREIKETLESGNV